jgi:hypothetical protein
VVAHPGRRQAATAFRGKNAAAVTLVAVPVEGAGDLDRPPVGQPAVGQPAVRGDRIVHRRRGRDHATARAAQVPGVEVGPPRRRQIEQLDRLDRLDRLDLWDSSVSHPRTVRKRVAVGLLDVKISMHVS